MQQISKPMKKTEKKPKKDVAPSNTLGYHKWSDMTVKAFLNETKKRVRSGRILINALESEATFNENEPRGPRSVEVSRDKHCRCVRRPDGDYTLTFRFNPTEKFVTEALVAEIRSVVNVTKKDKEAQLLQQRQKKEEGGDND